MRLNKYISHNSKYSRREADQMILDGFVNIHRKKITNPAYQVQDNDKVFVKGKLIKNIEDKLTVIVYNKPKGEIVTKKDPQGRKTIYDSLPKKFHHFIPIGRLDFASEGVLLLSDNVNVVNKLSSSNLVRIYKLKVNGYISPKIEKAMLEGITIKGIKGAHKNTNITTMNIAPFNSYLIQKNDKNFSKLKVGISEGKNRELRRFFGYFDLEVLDLKRIDFGGIELNNLPSGKYRYLNKNEYKKLKDFVYNNQTT
jgi:23S rRNA pseudouridine2605 synthase